MFFTVTNSVCFSLMLTQHYKSAFFVPVSVSHWIALFELPNSNYSTLPFTVFFHIVFLRGLISLVWEDLSWLIPLRLNSNNTLLCEIWTWGKKMSCILTNNFSSFTYFPWLLSVIFHGYYRCWLFGFLHICTVSYFLYAVSIGTIDYGHNSHPVIRMANECYSINSSCEIHNRNQFTIKWLYRDSILYQVNDVSASLKQRTFNVVKTTTTLMLTLIWPACHYASDIATRTPTSSYV